MILQRKLEKINMIDKAIKISFGTRNSSLYKFIGAKSRYIVKEEDKEVKLMEVEAITFQNWICNTYI